MRASVVYTLGADVRIHKTINNSRAQSKFMVLVVQNNRDNATRRRLRTAAAAVITTRHGIYVFSNETTRAASVCSAGFFVNAVIQTRR